MSASGGGGGGGSSAGPVGALAADSVGKVSDQILSVLSPDSLQILKDLVIKIPESGHSDAKAAGSNASAGYVPFFEYHGIDPGAYYGMPASRPVRKKDS